jgi:hypothetical protein
MINKLILSFVIILITNLTIAQDNISLISPFDSDTIETKNPLLTWAYLGGLEHNNDRVYYRIIVVELQEEQSAEAGLIVNQPLIKMDRIPGTQLFYPYDAPELKEGIWYGWQIQKISNNVIIDKSEAWKFILPMPKDHKPQYYKMKVKNDGVVYQAVDGKLYLHFEEQYSDGDLTFYLYNNRNELMDVNITLNPGAEEKDQEINVKKTGSNFYEIDLGDFAMTGVYRLVIYDGKKQKYEMKYEVK